MEFKKNWGGVFILNNKYRRIWTRGKIIQANLFDTFVFSDHIWKKTSKMILLFVKTYNQSVIQFDTMIFMDRMDTNEDSLFNYFSLILKVGHGVPAASPGARDSDLQLFCYQRYYNLKNKYELL